MNGQELKKDIKKVLFHYASYYKLFILFIVGLLVFTYFYNKTLVPVYKNKASIHLVKDLSSFFTTDFSFETSVASPQMGMRYGMGLDDELTLLNSFATIQRTLEQLEFEVTYFRNDTIFSSIPVLNKFTKPVELYGAVPIKVNYDASHPQPVYKEFTVTKLSDSTCKLSCLPEEGSLYNYIDRTYLSELDGKRVEAVLPFNKVFENDILKFQIQRTEYFKDWPVGSQISFKLNDIDALTLEYKSYLSFYQPSPTSFIINVSIEGRNFAKITRFLNAFTENILNEDLTQKNDLAVSTIDFIDAQLGEISDSLNLVKSNLERFRSVNKVTDLSFQGQRLFDIISEIESQKVTLQMQERYYTYLIDYLSNKEDNKELISPASMNVVDPLLTNMISQLSALYSQYNNYSESSVNAIYLNDLKIKMNNQESAILENASNNLSTIQLSINELNYRLQKSNKDIAQLPKTELQLFDIERKFKLNDAVLTFLMQKRSEAQIAMSSTKPSYNIVEPARLLGGKPIAPKTKLNYIIAFLVGGFIPLLFILIKDFLDYKVRDKYDIKDIRNYTFVGKIHRNEFKGNLVVVNHSDSIVSESFRAVRTNLQFMLDYSESRIFAITSSSSGEGKSFFAANLAASYAASNYKTVLLEFDLRRPQVGKNFGVSSSLGLTSYLSNNATIDDIVLPLDEAENLDLILAGDRAPNPSDLIASERTKELFEYLKTVYDIIIIDTAPVGIVSESYYLLGESDLKLFVVRQDYSNKEMVADTLEQLHKNEIGKFGVVLNDVSGKSISSYQQSGYRKYYVDEPSQGFWSGLFSR